MAKEYIEREAVLEIMGRLYKHHLSMMNYSADSATYDCMQVVKEAPAADVKEVVHGVWKPVSLDDQYEGIFKCSVCKTTQFFESGYPSYYDGSFCPNCGADMRGRKE